MSTKRNKKITNKYIIGIFKELFKIHKALGNVWEAKSYNRIIEILENYKKPITSSSNLKDIPEIGKRTLDKIDEIIKTGHLKLLDNMEKNKKIMARVELYQVLGIGPKMAEKLVNKGIMSREQLMKAYKEGNVDLTKMEYLGLKYYDGLSRRIPRKEVDDYVEKLDKVLSKKYPDVVIIPAGSYRRGAKDSGDIDIIISFPDIATKKQLLGRSHEIMRDIIETMKDNKLLKEIVREGLYDSMLINNKIQQVDLKIAPYDLIPFFLVYFGSGEDFSRKIRQIAKDKGYKLSQWGLNPIMDKANTEKNIFNKLNMKYVEPKNR